MIRLVLVLLRLQLLVTGWDLYSTLADQAQTRNYYDSIPPMACPRCGEPMKPGPPEQPGILFCDFDFFTYPADWDAESMSGL